MSITEWESDGDKFSIRGGRIRYQTEKELLITCSEVTRSLHEDDQQSIALMLAMFLNMLNLIYEGKDDLSMLGIQPQILIRDLRDVLIDRLERYERLLESGSHKKLKPLPESLSLNYYFTTSKCSAILVLRQVS